MKDPAFLFYSKDFSLGTQDMSCEEVGAYMRLLIYQHQHGSIPSDVERMMRITGIFSEEKFNNVWEIVGQKFKKMDNHLVNERLSKEVSERLIGRPKKIASATLAGLISSSNLKPKQVKKIKENFKTDDFIYVENELLTDINALKSNINEWFKKMVNQMVKNIADANGDANEDEIIDRNINTKTSDSGPPESENLQNESLIYPFESEGFMNAWKAWIEYKKSQFNFEYKSATSKQAALTELSNLSSGIEDQAIAIIRQSVANGWKGLFKIKMQNEQFSNDRNSRAARSAQRAREIEEINAARAAGII